MLKILYRQPLHIWQTLEKRHKLEAIILFILIYAFTATRLLALFNLWLVDVFTALELSALISQIFILQIILSAVFIIAWNLPRQKNLMLFFGNPIRDKMLYKLLFYYSFKYLSIYLILFLPVLTALLFSAGIFYTLSCSALVVSVSFLFMLLFFFIKQRFPLPAVFVLFSMLIIILYATFLGVFIFLFKTDLLIFQVIIFLAGLSGSFFLYNRQSKTGLESFISYIQKVYRKNEILTTTIKIPRFLPQVIQAMFEKEILGLWRNPNYKKLKIFSLLNFFILNSLILFSTLEYKIIGFTIVTALLIWLHYNNSFNEKYVYPDPEWLIRTKPIRFRQLLAAKYFAEVPFVVVLILSMLFFILLTGNNETGQFSALVFIFLFAHFVIFSMLNFQIMFFNDPRLAGYAFNFTLVFILIMILNYRLTGPIIGLALLTFFFYKNVKYFNE